MMRKAISEHGKLFVVKVVYGILISLCSICAIKYFQVLIDRISLCLLTTYKPDDIIQTVWPPLLLYAFFSLGDCLINYLEEYPDAKLKQKLYYYFKTSAVDKISRAKYGFIQNYGPGQLIQVIENGAIAGRDIIVSFYLSILAGQVPKMVLSMLFLGTYNIRIMLIIGIGYIVVFLVTKNIMRKM